MAMVILLFLCCTALFVAFICCSGCTLKASFEALGCHHYIRLYPLHSCAVVPVWTFQMSHVLGFR